MNFNYLFLVDLHTHLGSSVTSKCLWDLAHSRGIKLPTNSYHEFVESMETVVKIPHKEFLNKYHLAQVIQSSPEAIEKCVYEAVSLAYRKANITTLELKFNVLLRNQQKFYNVDSILTYACIGLEKAKLAYPVDCGLIVETDRTFDSKKSIILAEKAVKFKDRGVVGFDMSGHTTFDFDYKEHSKAFKIAKDGGLGITVHAGEVDSSELMFDMIKEYKPDRIGHGIAAATNLPLMEYLRENNICLEICPTSNVVTKTVKDYESIKMKLECFKRNNVPFTLNSDGSLFLGTNVKREYEIMMGFMENKADKEFLLENAKNAYKYSFLNGFRSKLI